jgi:tetratricopeptide (TPR) repeat protein
LAPARNTLATLLDLAGKSDAAIEELRRAVAADPNYAEAHFNLATLLRRRGDAAEAAPHFQKAFELNPQLRPPTND